MSHNVSSFLRVSSWVYSSSVLKNLKNDYRRCLENPWAFPEWTINGLKLWTQVAVYHHTSSVFTTTWSIPSISKDNISIGGSVLAAALYTVCWTVSLSLLYSSVHFCMLLFSISSNHQLPSLPSTMTDVKRQTLNPQWRLQVITFTFENILMTQPTMIGSWNQWKLPLIVHLL